MRQGRRPNGGVILSPTSRYASSPEPSTSSLTDAALLAAVARGEPTALDRLYERHAAMVFSVAMRVIADPVEAEEVALEFFLRLWRRAGTFDPARGGGGAWLRRVAHNLAIYHARQRRLTTRLWSLTDDHAEV